MGNKVDSRIRGGGSSRNGHHLGILVASRAPKGSLGNTDSGEALGDRGRRLGGLEEIWVGHGSSVYAGNGIGGDTVSGTASFKMGGREHSPGANTGDE